MLKQLLFLLGETKFSSVLKDYLIKFSFKNANIDDFFSCLKPYFVDLGIDIDI